jgi:hypothetical protein
VEVCQLVLEDKQAVGSPLTSSRNVEELEGLSSPEMFPILGAFGAFVHPSVTCADAGQVGRESLCSADTSFDFHEFVSHGHEAAGPVLDWSKSVFLKGQKWLELALNVGRLPR